MIAVPMRIAASQVAVPLSVSASTVEIPVSLGVAYATYEGETYQGAYEFTPTTQTQTVQTANKVLLENITINPIPSDWGHITWNGSVLTVS